MYDIKNQELEVLMQERLQENPPKRALKLYADKIYYTCCCLEFTTWSSSADENFLMSKIRVVGIEWTFGTI
jgi:hypothetical protein